MRPIFQRVVFMLVFLASSLNAHDASSGYIQTLNKVQADINLAQKLKSLNKNTYYDVGLNNFDPVQFIKDNLNTLNNLFDSSSRTDINPMCINKIQQWFVALLNITNNPQQWPINGDYLILYHFPH